MQRILSQSVTNILYKINPGKRPDGEEFIPYRFDGIISRFSGDKFHDWFVTFVDNISEEDPSRIAIEDNIAFLGHIKWKEKKLTYLNLQAIIILDSDIESFYLKDDANYHYLRFDYDLNNLGPLFKEQLPHVHIQPKGAPRFPFHFSDSGNSIVDFLEFIYINYKYDTWYDWLEELWESAPEFGSENDQFYNIVDSYKRNNSNSLLNEHRNQLNLIKKYAKDAKDRAYPLRIDLKNVSALNYPM